jgi:DNA-binding response OmpR family regulator
LGGLVRRFRIRESSTIEFRTEIFNIFNKANFAVPSTTLNNALPTITSTGVRRGHAIKLPRTEFLIFSRLRRTPDRIVTVEDLRSSVWGSNKPLNTESLHVYIYLLRAKLSDFGCTSRRW